jgi:hypothetical protein
MQHVLMQTLTDVNCVELLLLAIDCDAKTLREQTKVYIWKRFYLMDGGLFDAVPVAVLAWCSSLHHEFCHQPSALTCLGWMIYEQLAL